MRWYSYDRRASTTKSLQQLIVQAITRGRSFKGLMHAYIEAVQEDYEEEHGERVPDPPEDRAHQSWYAQHLGFLFTPDDIERAVQKAHAKVYCPLTGTNPSDAAEVFTLPDDFVHQSGIPLELAEAIGAGLARQDAQDALALRQEAQRRSR
jgi:hypothetical protein